MKVKVFAPPFLDGTDIDEMGWMEVPNEATLGDVYKKLRVPFILRRVLFCSVNYENSRLDQKLKEGDIISFFTPISGG